MGYSARHSKEVIFHYFRSHVSSGKADFFAAAGLDFCFGRRDGAYVWDVAGEKRLIDCHCNGGVFNLGHRNPEIVQALMRALQELDIGNHHLISEQRAILARELAKHTPADLNYTVFGVGGGEAVDLAIKLSRGATGRPKIISASGGYHGHTGFALAAGHEKYRKPFEPMAPGFLQVPFGEAEALDRALDTETAAVLLETIPATLGMPLPPDDYLPAVRRMCDDRGALLILDEVQTGLGRTGLLWGMDHYRVVPDILVIGKGLSGGIYPMSATCFREPLEPFFHDDPFIHVSTFGGAEVGCPVAMKVLEISSEPVFLENVRKLAGRFAEGFAELKDHHPEILVGLRQKGLFMGIEMVNELCGPVLSKTCMDRGLLAVYANNDKRVTQLLPPLNIPEPLVDEILIRLDRALGDAKTLLQLA